MRIITLTKQGLTNSPAPHPDLDSGAPEDISMAVIIAGIAAMTPYMSSESNLPRENMIEAFQAGLDAAIQVLNSERNSQKSISNSTEIAGRIG